MAQTDRLLLNDIKAWIFPGLIAILGAIIWNDIKEIKNDVKALMAQSNIDKTRIDNIEKQISFFGSGTLKPASLLENSKPIVPGPARKEVVIKDLYIDTRQKKILAVYGKRKVFPTV